MAGDTWLDLHGIPDAMDPTTEQPTRERVTHDGHSYDLITVTSLHGYAVHVEEDGTDLARYEATFRIRTDDRAQARGDGIRKLIEIAKTDIGNGRFEPHRAAGREG